MVEGERKKEDTYLEYKQHNGFFKEFDALRSNYLQRNYEFLSAPNQNKNIALAGSLLALIDWTRGQLSQYIDVGEMKKRVWAIRNKTKFHEMYEEYDKIFGEISNLFEKAELVPKVHKTEEDESAKWWKDEEHKAIREMKKAFYDILIIK